MSQNPATKLCWKPVADRNDPLEIRHYQAETARLILVVHRSRWPGEKKESWFTGIMISLTRMRIAYFPTLTEAMLAAERMADIS